MDRARQILHVDMDAFYASVEQRDDPSIRGKPVVVGGHAKRGVVSAASYEARMFGIHSAMPMVEAMRRCPSAIVVSPRIAHYAEVSDRVFGIFRRFSPLVEGLSLDEAFIDVTASQALFGTGEQIAQSIKSAIQSEVGLTASAGVAPCKFVAKIASDLRKPDGLVCVTAEGVRGFLDPLPIERMWGVGGVTAKRLHQAGFRTIGQLASADPARLERLMGSWGREVHQLAQGVDPRAVEVGVAAKSIGAEVTFEQDLPRGEELLTHLLGQAERVSHRLLRQGLMGTVLVVKLKYADFSLLTRRIQLPEPVCDTATIYHAAVDLLDRFPWGGRKVRLVGVSVGELCTEAPLLLFSNPGSDKRKRLEKVMLEIQDRYGSGGVHRADLADISNDRKR